MSIYSYASVKAVLTMNDMPHKAKWDFMFRILKKNNISMLDLLNLMPSSACAQLMLDYKKNYDETIDIFKGAFNKGVKCLEFHRAYDKRKQTHLFSRIQNNGVEMKVHTFFMNEILPRGLFHLITQGHVDLDHVFRVMLNFWEMEQIRTKPKNPKELVVAEKSFLREIWILNTINLIKNMDYFVRKLFKKEKKIFDTVLEYLKNLKNALESGTFQYFAVFPNWQVELINILENRIEVMKTMGKEKDKINFFNIHMGSKLKLPFYVFITQGFDPKIFENFENSYQKDESVKFLKEKCKKGGTIQEIIDILGKRLDRILVYNRTDKLELLQEIIELIRFNDILIFDIPEINEKHNLLTRIILWRIFSFCLYTDFAPIFLFYFYKRFADLKDHIQGNHYDYLHSLFCYLYISDSRNKSQKNAKANGTKELVHKVATEILKVLDMKQFGFSNYFLRLDYENPKLTQDMKHFIKVLDTSKVIFEKIADDLISSRKFTEKTVLILAYTRKILLNYYITPSKDSNTKAGLLKLYSALMLLFDVSEIKMINYKVKPSNYFIKEIKFKHIMECIGLIGTFENSCAPDIDRFQDGYENNSNCNFDSKTGPKDLGIFLEDYIKTNMFYTNLTLSAIFKAQEKVKRYFVAEESAHSQLYYEKMNLEDDSQNFDMIKWICKLAVSTPSEFYNVFDLSLEILVGDTEIAFVLIPFILYIILQNCTSDVQQGIAKDFNNVFTNGSSFHKMILVNTIKQLDRWFHDDSKHIQAIMQEIYEEKNPKTKSSKSIAPKLSDKEMKQDKFCTFYVQLKRQIDMDKMIASQARFVDYKSAALNLEKLLENIVNNSTSEEQITETYLEKLGQLYSIYSSISEDFKEISFETLLKRLKIPYDSRKLDGYVSQIFKYKYPEAMSIINLDAIQHDNKHLLLNEREFELWCAVYYRSVPVLNDDTLFFVLISCLVFLSAHLMLTPTKDETRTWDIVNLAKKIIDNARVSLIISVLNPRHNYGSLYPLFLKVQMLTDFEILFQIFRYANKYSGKVNLALIQSMNIESQGIDISLDDRDSNYFLNSPPVEAQQHKVIYFLNACIRQIDERTHMFDTSYKNKCHWLSVIKFMTNLMRESVKYYFDQDYFNFLYKLLKLTYKNNDLEKALIFKEKLTSFNLDKLSNPTKCALSIAKLIKKTKGRKDAMKLLDKIVAKEESDKIYEIKAKIKIAKYMIPFYAEGDIIDKFKNILQTYSANKNEYMYFQYAKYLDDTNPEPDLSDCREIIKYYLESVKHGHRYLFQSLPRALRIWLDNAPEVTNNAEKTSKKSQIYKDICDIVYTSLSGIETYKLVHIIQFFVSRLDHHDEDVVDVMCQTLSRIINKFPLQSVWWILPLKYFNFKDPRAEFSKSIKLDKAQRILTICKKSNPEAFKIISDAEPFYKALLEFALGKDVMPEILTRDYKYKCLIVPTREFLYPRLPKKNEPTDESFNPYHENPLFLLSMDPRFVTMPSKEKPKKVTFICSQGKRIAFLLKYEPKGDVRKESRTIEYVNFINLIFENSSIVKNKDLEMKCFTIIPLCTRLNLSEWVNETATLSCKRALNRIFQYDPIVWD